MSYCNAWWSQLSFNSYNLKSGEFHFNKYFLFCTDKNNDNTKRSRNYKLV